MIKHAERLETIHPYVKQKFIEAYNEIEQKYGYEILVVFGTRSLIEQGKIYRQGRSKAEINTKIEQLRDRGMGEYADAIVAAGAQNGKIVTYAAPGESIHNYGLAIDYVRMVDGECAWEDETAYKNCSEIFKAHGFSCGYYWEGKKKDSPHIEMTEGMGWRDLMAGKKPSFMGALNA